MTVRKGNKVLQIDEKHLGSYLADGFDQIDDKGKILKEASNKMLTSAEVAKLKAEHIEKIAELESKLAEKTKVNTPDIDTAK